MSNPSIILPSVIVGPAIVTWNGNSYYTKAGIKAEFKRDTFKVSTDIDGDIDERMKAQMTKVSFQPVGMMGGASTAMAAYFPYSVVAVGKSVFGTTDLPLVIQTKFGGSSNNGQTITYPRAAVTKFPQLRLKPTDTLFGDMTFTCLGDPTVAPSGSTAWETIANNPFGDATFDETQIVTDSYVATWGSSSPYNSMGSMAGFEIDLQMATDKIDADDYGHVDLILKSLTATAKFAPSNLTQAQMSALLACQGSTSGTAYVYPGQSLAIAGNDLVIAGTGNGARVLSVIIHKAGPKQGGFMYSTGKHRLEAVEFTSRRTWTTSLPNALWSISIS